MNMDEKNAVLAGLVPMFAKARAEGLWFHCGYQDLWFSPDELDAANKEGRFIWGAVNWTLRDPRERLEQLKNAIVSAEAAKAQFMARMQGSNVEVTGCASRSPG